MSQEGRGRVEERKQKVFFSYETLNSPEENEFKLALDIPLYGSEFIIVNYKDPANPKFRLEGAKKKKGKVLKSLKRFVTNFANFIVLREAITRNGESKYCVDQGKYMECSVSPGSESFRIKKLKKMMRVISTSNSASNLEFEFYDIKETHFSRIKASFRNQTLKKPYFQADLFLGECYDKK